MYRRSRISRLYEELVLYGTRLYVQELEGFLTVNGTSLARVYLMYRRFRASGLYRELV